MQEDKVAGAEAINPGVTGVPRIVPYERPRREAGFHFVDHLLREAKTLVGMQSLTSESYTVRSTINSKLQRATEEALQNGLARYEASSGRAKYEGPELNLGEITARVTTEQSTHALRRGRVVKPVWQIALQSARLPLYDVHWPAAVVLSNGGKAQIKVGLDDGRIVPLAVPEYVAADALHVNDVIYVNVIEGKNRSDAKAELRIRPKVQGATVVLENKTGRILAMVGGFSYPLSQLNRTSQALRQPGSSIKPLTYLAALHRGLQPNTLVLDAPVTLPSIPGVTTHSWTPKNYDSSSWGSITLRRALENSKNLVTARLLDGGIDKDPSKSLEQICDLAMEAKIYPECIKNYPFVLGAQGLRMIDLAGFYAAIVNEGLRVTPYAIDSIEQNGHAVYKHQAGPPHMLADGDRAAFYQLRTMLEGVVERGTAASMRASGAFRRRQDRHHRKRERCLVRRLHQRRHRRGLGRLRQRPRQADARPRQHRRTHRRPHRRADHPGHLEYGRAEDAVAAAVGGGRAAPQGAADRLRQRAKARGQQPRRFHRVFQARRQQKGAGHSICAGWPPQPGGGAASPRWEAVPDRAPRSNMIEERPQYVSPSNGGRLPPSDRVPRNLRELFGM